MPSIAAAYLCFGWLTVIVLLRAAILFGASVQCTVVGL